MWQPVRRRVIAVLVILAGMAFTYAPAPASVAAAQPPGAGTIDPQLSTPKLAALAFVRAMESDNMDAFRGVTIGADEDYQLFEPLVGMVGAAKQLEKAAREKFGKAGRAVVRASPAVGLEVQVQESDVTVNGDTAILRQKSQEDADPLTLRKTPVGWKIDLTAIQNRQAMTDAGPGMRKMREVFTGSAADIRAGRFKNPEEAEQAVVKRMQQAAATVAQHPQSTPPAK